MGLSVQDTYNSKVNIVGEINMYIASFPLLHVGVSQGPPRSIGYSVSGLSGPLLALKNSLLILAFLCAPCEILVTLDRFCSLSTVVPPW